MFRSFDPDDPLAADRRYLSADERGSVISVSDSNGAALGINSYDEYGNPGASNLGRYGYTGQAWLAGAQLWYLNARMYSPAIGGRFMQPDPIGYAGGINLYAYTGNDPVNFVDPLGLDRGITKIPPCEEDPKCILVVARRAGPAIGGAVRPPPPPRATPAQPKPTPKPRPRPEICARFSSAVYVLNFVGNAADIAALGSIGAAAITSPAPPVAAGFATFAAVAKGVSLAAGVGVTAIHAINGNWGSAATSAGSTAIGQFGGRGLQALGRTEGKQVGDLTAAAAETGAGQAVNAGGC